jgi:hypothetical protein
MASLVDSLMQQLEDKGAVNQIAAKLGIEPEKASSALSAAVPGMLAGLARNTQKPDGAAALAGALEKDHDGSVLDEDGYFDHYQEKKGDKILSHVFGAKEAEVETKVAAFGGLAPGQGADLMKMVAPLVMGYLGKEKKEGGLDIGSLASMLGGAGGGGGGAGGGLNLPGGLGDLLDGLRSRRSQAGSVWAGSSPCSHTYLPPPRSRATNFLESTPGRVRSPHAA